MAMDRTYVVGSVPYVNARPLVSYFEEAPDRFPVRVIYEVPSRLPALLDSGGADVVLASSIDALLTPDRRIAANLCIATRGPVSSVRLFSKKPPKEIQSLALDLSSMTSNALAGIVLEERYGVRPESSPEPPDLGAMLRKHDACVLIGDIGMRAGAEGLHVLDLGQEWTSMTGLPFVWALWIGGERLDEKLAGYLSAARSMSCLGASFDTPNESRRREALKKILGPFEFDRQIEERRLLQINQISQASSWTSEEVRKYLTETISFDLGELELDGLREFGRRLQSYGIPADHFPGLVSPTRPLAGYATPTL